MSLKEMFQAQFAYNRQMNDEFLALANDLSIMDLNADHEYAHGKIMRTLYHIIATEMVWRQLSFGGRIMSPIPKEAEFNSIEKLQMFHDKESVLMLEQLERFRPSDLVETIVATDWKGNEHRLKRWQMLSHLLNHSMQHRSEVAMWLTQKGVSPGNIDLIMFYMQRNQTN